MALLAVWLDDCDTDEMVEAALLELMVNIDPTLVWVELLDRLAVEFGPEEMEVYTVENEPEAIEVKMPLVEPTTVGPEPEIVEFPNGGAAEEVPPLSVQEVLGV